MPRSRNGRIFFAVAICLLMAVIASNVYRRWRNSRVDVLAVAADAGDIATVRNLLDQGVDPNVVGELPSGVKATALMLAGSRGRLEIVKLLLERKANLEVRDPNGWTALAYAVGFVRPSCVRAMVAKGANVNARNTGGIAPVVLAVRDAEVMRILLDHGADVQARSVEGTTAVISAGSWGNVDSLRLLLDHGSNVNDQDRTGWSALLRATSAGHEECVRLLVARGADVNVRAADGHTPLNLAQRKRYTTIASVLKTAGAKE